MGEALTHCHMNDGWITTPDEIYAYAKAGPLTGSGPPEDEWCNYLIAQVALDPTSMWDWHFVGYAQVFSDTFQWYDLGSTYWLYPYNHVSISTMCPAQWYPIEKSDVLVDLAYTVSLY